MRIKTPIAILLILSASTAFASFHEIEPNNTLAQANPLVLPAGLQADIGLAALAANDVDYYSVFLSQGKVLTAMTTPTASLPTNFAAPDTLLALVNANGQVIIEDDDAGIDAVGAALTTPVRGSAIRFENTGLGATFYLKVRGFLNQQSGPYSLTFSITPAAGASILEAEPNDTIATANPIAPTCASAGIRTGTLTTNDADVFSILLPQGGVLTAITTPLASLPVSFGSPDTLLEVLTGAGALVMQSNDAGTDAIGANPIGPVAGSAIRFQNSGAAATYYLRVRGVSSQQTGAYSLTLSVTPAIGIPPGDVNGDGLVNGRDIRSFVNILGSTGPVGQAFCAADMNRDGTITIADVQLFVTALLAP